LGMRSGLLAERLLLTVAVWVAGIWFCDLLAADPEDPELFILACCRRSANRLPIWLMLVVVGFCFCIGRWRAGVSFTPSLQEEFVLSPFP